MALSVGDILTALINIPSHIIAVHLMPDDTCNVLGIEHFIAVFLGTSATILTSCICMDRYIFISRNRRSTSNQTRLPIGKLFVLYCTIAYVIAVAMSIAVLFIINGKMNFEEAYTFNKVSIAVYSLILLVSLVFNVLLVRFIQRQSKEIKRHLDVKAARQNKATKTVLIISAILTFSIMPMGIGLAIMTFFFTEEEYVENLSMNYYIYIWLRMPMFLNSFLNAIVFIYRNRPLIVFFRSLSSRIRSSGNPQTTIDQVIQNVHFKEKNTSIRLELSLIHI